MLIYLPTGRRDLNVNALVCAFNQEKALVGAFSVTVKTSPISTIYNQSTYPVSTLRRKSMTVLLGTVLPGNIPSRTRHSCITPSLSRDPGARNIVAARCDCNHRP